MNPLIYLASYDDLAQIAISSKPNNYVINGISDPNILLLYWLKHWGNLHYINHGQLEIAQGLRKKPDFDPWCYIAGYPQIKQMVWQNDTLNEDQACFLWIVSGRINNLQKHKFPHSISKLILNWSGKSIYVLGNARELPKHLKKIQFKHNSVIIGFNKIINHIPDNIVFDKVICNTVIYKKQQNDPKCMCISDFQIENNESNTFLLTTGLIFINWLLNNVSYEHIYIAGFNMVEPGKQAHFFDFERPAFPGPMFPGHNASYEKEFLKNLDKSNHNVSVIFS